MSDEFASAGGETTERLRLGARFDVVAFAVLCVGALALPILFWPWSSDTFVGPKFGAVRLTTAAAAAAAAASLALRRNGMRLLLPDWAASIFLLLATFASAFSVKPTVSLFGEPLQHAGLVATFGFAGAYGVARVVIRSHQRLRGLVLAAAAAASIVGAYGVMQLAGFDPWWSELPNGRVFSLLGQPNWLGAYLVMTVPLTVALAVDMDDWRAKAALSCSVIVQIVVLLGTLSRAGLLGLLAALGVGVVALVVRRSRGRSINWARVIGLGALAGLTGAALVGTLSLTTSSVAPTAVIERAASITDVRAFDIRQHMALWTVAWAITADNPLTGTGPDTYATVFPDYRDRALDPYYAEYLSTFRPESPHNVYLAHASGAGIPALVAYATFLVSSISFLVRSIGRAGRSSPLLIGVLAAVSGHVVTDTFMSLELASSWLFWALLGATITVASTADETPQQAT